MPMIGPQQAQRDGFISRLRTYVLERGRDPASIGIDPIRSLAHGGPVPEGDASLRTLEESMRDLEVWQALARPMSRSTPWTRASRSRSTLTPSSSSRKWSTQQPNPSRIRLRSVRTTDRVQAPTNNRPHADQRRTGDGPPGSAQICGARSWAAASVDVGASGSPKSERPSSLLCSGEF
jgi:hypothetical protein